MIHISYGPETGDRFILVTTNTLNDVVNLPQKAKPTKLKNRVGFWRIKPKKK